MLAPTSNTVAPGESESPDRKYSSTSCVRNIASSSLRHSSSRPPPTSTLANIQSIRATMRPRFHSFQGGNEDGFSRQRHQQRFVVERPQLNHTRVEQDRVEQDRV